VPLGAELEAGLEPELPEPERELFSLEISLIGTAEAMMLLAASPSEVV
jgi:hypothetical protein